MANAVKPRKMTQEERSEIEMLVRIAVAKRFEVELIRKNTALFNPGGQEFLEKQEKLAEILENEKNLFVQNKLYELGYQPGDRVKLNVLTGDFDEF